MALTNADAQANGFNSAVRDAWLSANYMPLFTQRSPVLKMLQMRRGITKPRGFGDRMREPIMVPVTTGPQFTGQTTGYAEENPEPMTGYTSAYYYLSQYKIDVSWDDYDTVRGGDPVEMVRWSESHFKNALLRSFNTLLKHMWDPPETVGSTGIRTRIASLRTLINSGGSSTTDGGAQPAAQANQLNPAVVGATGTTAVKTPGDLNRDAAGAAYWCSNVWDTSGTPAVAALTVQVLNDIYEDAYQDGEEPDLCIVPPGLYSKLQNLLTVGGGNGGQVFGESRLAKLGFSAIKFRNAELVVDKRCPTTGFVSGTSTALGMHLFMLNMRHLFWRTTGNKPKFKEVVSNRLIEEHVGSWYGALTADHLGNVHSLHPFLSQ